MISIRSVARRRTGSSANSRSCTPSRNPANSSLASRMSANRLRSSGKAHPLPADGGGQPLVRQLDDVDLHAEQAFQVELGAEDGEGVAGRIDAGRQVEVAVRAGVAARAAAERHEAAQSVALGD